MINVLINGANGKMGKAIMKIIEENPSYNMKVTARRDENLTEGDTFDLVIDFSLPGGAQSSFELAKKHNAAFITGTTNLPKDFTDALKQETQIPVFYSPNVSIGVYLFTKLIQDAVNLFPAYAKSMHEIHHDQKKDAPSGTAKSLAAAVNFPEQEVTYERVGTVPGTHSLKLTSPAGDEEITLTHNAVDRVLFAYSAVQVAAWLAKQKPGFYDMKAFVESTK